MNTNPKFIMMIGAPCSGKSTWINDFIASSSDEWTIASTDAILEEWAAEEGISYSDAFKHISFKKVQSKFNAQVRQSFNQKKNIIWDQTNMTVNSRRKKLSQVPKDYECRAVVFEIDRDELTRRGDKRKIETGKEVPVKVIDQMIESYVRPIKSEGFKKVTIINS